MNGYLKTLSKQAKVRYCSVIANGHEAPLHIGEEVVFWPEVNRVGSLHHSAPYKSTGQLLRRSSPTNT